MTQSQIPQGASGGVRFPEGLSVDTDSEEVLVCWMEILEAIETLPPAQREAACAELRKIVASLSG